MVGRSWKYWSRYHKVHNPNLTASTHSFLTRMGRYVDGNIVRTGVEGDQDTGAYSGGRGGAGNIGSPGLNPTHRKDAEAVPEAALRPSSEDQTYHIGRGGGGNVHSPDTTQKKKTGEELSLADKIKNKLFKKNVEKHDHQAETSGH